jgi:hypothetical protein
VDIRDDDVFIKYRANTITRDCDVIIISIRQNTNRIRLS